MRRVLYFLITNLAIVIVLGIVLRILGVEPYLTAYGLNYQSLLIFSAVFGMGGAFISLALSKWSAKRLTRAQVVTSPANETERWLVTTIGELASRASIRMPEVAIFPSDDMNAFATGMKRNNALVAVSSGMLRRMDKENIRAVLAHEVAHVKNGDMITLALIQGVVNTFVIFFARVIGYTVDRVIFRNERGHGIGFWVTTIIAEICLAMLASIIVLWFFKKKGISCRQRFCGFGWKKANDRCTRSLENALLQQPHLPDQMAAFGTPGLEEQGLKALFATHPNLDDRINTLMASKYPDYKP